MPEDAGVTSPDPESAPKAFSGGESDAVIPANPEVQSTVSAHEDAPPPATTEEPVYAPKPQTVRPERRPEPPRHKPWVKPPDFRAADTSAIHQAVVHATEIAESLRGLTDQIDEILELVEVAERQKLADERELDNLRRALRRIQPPRQAHQHEPQRGHSHSRADHRPRQESSPPPPEHFQPPEPAHEPQSEVAEEPEEAREPEASSEESQREL